MVFKLTSFFITQPLRVALMVKARNPEPLRVEPLEPRPGDCLVLLDSSWHADFFALAEKLKREGVSIISVVYDLIPLTHPQFCDAGLVKVFDVWFDWVAKTADGFVAISETIKNQVRDEIEHRLGAEVVAKRWFRHFRLGSDLDLIHASARQSERLMSAFDRQGHTYLMVSTIEPRKNHSYLLDAFDLLWAAGSPVRLCIIGKIGWKCDALIERIRQHPEFGKRLLMFNNASDSELEFAYGNARALVFPSFVEGFGLPLVEAMQRGLPAMASDIPVFREVGQDYLVYFDLSTPTSLADCINRFEADGTFQSEQALTQWRWPGWRDASQEFIDRVEEGLASAAPRLT